MSIKGNMETREALVGSIHLLKKIPGYSAYEIAVKHGFKGTEAEWLVSISAYGIAVMLGFEGTVEEWIASLKGEKGDIGNVELHGDIDALGERIKNVADPVDEKDAVNKSYADTSIAAARLYADKVGENVKKYVDDKNDASEEFVSENYVKKTDQLDALGMTVKNVAEPSADTDAVNKKYVHDTFQKGAFEDISDDFISRALNGFTVTSVKVFKQENVINGELTVRGDFANTEYDAIPIVDITNAYKPLVKTICPTIVQTLADGSTHLYLGDFVPNVYIDNLIGYVMVGGFNDNSGFTNEVVFSFTYLC